MTSHLAQSGDPAFKACAGGRIGSGQQRVPWIAIDDLVDMIDRALYDERWSGVVNAVAREPASNRDFTRALGKALRRPAVLPVPAFAVRLLFGRMANETLLADLPVYSTRLEEEFGYQLRYPSLDEAKRVMRAMRGEDHGGPGVCDSFQTSFVSKSGEEIPVAISGSIVAAHPARSAPSA